MSVALSGSRRPPVLDTWKIRLRNSIIANHAKKFVDGKMSTSLRTLNTGVGLLDFGCWGRLNAIASRPRSNTAKSLSRVILMRYRGISVSSCFECRWSLVTCRWFLGKSFYCSTMFGDLEETDDVIRRRVLYSDLRVRILNIVWMTVSQYIEISKSITFGLPMTIVRRPHHPRRPDANAAAYGLMMGLFGNFYLYYSHKHKEVLCGMVGTLHIW